MFKIETAQAGTSLSQTRGFFTVKASYEIMHFEANANRLLMVFSRDLES